MTNQTNKAASSAASSDVQANAANLAAGTGEQSKTELNDPHLSCEEAVEKALSEQS